MSAGSAGPAKGSSCEMSTSSSASCTKRLIPRGVRSDVEVSATRFCLFSSITRIPRLRWPASFTSSGSPMRTLVESCEPERAMASATSAPPLRARSTTSAASFVRLSTLTSRRFDMAAQRGGARPRRNSHSEHALRVDEDCHRAIVLDVDHHVRPEPPGSHRDTPCTGRSHEVLVELLASMGSIAPSSRAGSRAARRRRA